MKTLNSYDFDKSFDQIENGEYLKLTDDLWKSLNSDEWKDVNPLGDFMKNTDRKNLRYIELPITKIDRFGLVSMDDTVNNKYLNFRKILFDKYDGKFLDLIDYHDGNVYIIKKME